MDLLVSLWRKLYFSLIKAPDDTIKKTPLNVPDLSLVTSVTLSEVFLNVSSGAATRLKYNDDDNDKS